MLIAPPISRTSWSLSISYYAALNFCWIDYSLRRQTDNLFGNNLDKRIMWFVQIQNRSHFLERGDHNFYLFLIER